MVDTVPVAFKVASLEPVRGAGRLIALAVVDVEIAGILVTLQGVQVRRRRNRGKTPGEHRTEAGQSGFDGQKMADFCGGRSAGGRMLHLLTRGFAPVTRRPDGGLECLAPRWRNPASGQWLPGVVLPAELQEALAGEVLAEAMRM